MGPESAGRGRKSGTSTALPLGRQAVAALLRAILRGAEKASYEWDQVLLAHGQRV